MNLISEVLRLDKEATQGWRKTTMEEAVDADGRCVLFDWRHHGADSDLILAYRTAAPKLARAFDRLRKEVVRMSYDKRRKTEAEILEMLAEIEKEISNG